MAVVGGILDNESKIRCLKEMRVSLFQENGRVLRLLEKKRVLTGDAYIMGEYLNHYFYALIQTGL